MLGEQSVEPGRGADDVAGRVETAALGDLRVARVARDRDLAGQLLVDAAQVEHQDAVDEDEEIVVAVEAERDAVGAVVDEVVAGLVGEVGVVLDAGDADDPAAVVERVSGRRSRDWITRGGKRYWSPVQVVQKGLPLPWFQ